MPNAEERKPFFCGGSGAPLGGSTGTYTSVGGSGERLRTRARAAEVDAGQTSDLSVRDAFGPLVPSGTSSAPARTHWRLRSAPQT